MRKTVKGSLRSLRPRPIRYMGYQVKNGEVVVWADVPNVGIGPENVGLSQFLELREIQKAVDLDAKLAKVYPTVLQ